MPRNYDIAAAVRAAVARINGEWDQPDLLAFGPLSTDTLADVRAILATVAAEGVAPC